MTSEMLDLLVRSTVLFGVAGFMAAALRRHAAAVQSFALTAALAAGLVLPATAWLPSWDLPVLEPLAVAAPQRSQTAPAFPLKVETVATAFADEVVDPASKETAAAGTQAPTPPASARSADWTVLAIWVFGATCVVTRMAFSHLRLRGLRRRARPMFDARWDVALRPVRAELGLARLVALRTSDEISVPIVSGVRWPVVIVPSAAETWPPAVVRDVLRHELAHVVRRDAWSQVADRLACAAYWFNPLAWALAGRAAALRERACDDEVLRAGTRASEYASRLIVLVRQCGGDRFEAALAMAAPSRMHQRIAHVLAADVRRGRAGRAAGAATIAAVSSVLLAVGLVQPVRAAVVPETFDMPLVAPDRVAAETEALPSPGGFPAAAHPAPRPWPLEVPQPAPQPGMCAGRMRNSSNQSTSDDGRRRSRIRMSGDGCEIDLQIDGRVEFNDDFTDVARIEGNGYFRLDATIDGTRRQLDITSRGGALERAYRVGGREQPWDAAATRWFADFLIALDRRTAIGVDVRLPNLLRQGGVAGVLAETARMPSDYVRSRYYAGLLDARQLSADERRQILDQAAALTGSDHYAAELLERIVAQGRIADPRERDAVVGLLKKMDSDHYRAEVMKVLAGGSLDAGQAKAVLDVLTAMESDHYRHEVLARLVTAAPADLDLSLAASVIRAMESDHYQAESVKVIARRLGDGQAAKLLPILATMESDHYRLEVIGEILARQIADAEVTVVADAIRQMRGDHYQAEAIGKLVARQTSEANLLAVVEVVRSMDSDHYQSEALRDVLGNAGATDRVRAAVREVAGTLSSHYQQEVIRRIR